MKVLKYNILNPEKSENLGNDAQIRFYFSKDDYIEIRWLREPDTLQVSKQSLTSQIAIMPVVSNQVELR